MASLSHLAEQERSLGISSSYMLGEAVFLHLNLINRQGVRYNPTWSRYLVVRGVSLCLY